VGKQANCQVSVHLAASTGEVAAPVAARLFLPESWAGDLERRARAGVPAQITFQTKPQMALELIRTVRQEGELPAAPVLGDCLYGHSGPLRHGLRELGCEYFLAVEPQTQAWTQPPLVRKARTRWRLAPRQARARAVLDLAQDLPPSAWQRAQWSTASGKVQATRLAWLRVWLWSDLDAGTGTIEPTWLVVDWPEGQPAPYHCYTAWLDGPPTRLRCLRLSRQRFHIEQYFQRDKDDLGLDHFEGRSWRGFHHHLALAAIAYLFVLIIFLRAKKNFLPHVGNSPAQDPAISHTLPRLLSLLSPPSS
jgi:SRSO17 transposase